MKVPINPKKIDDNKSFKNSLKNPLIDYEAELLLDEENYSAILNNLSMFKKKRISICKFYFHILEGIDLIFLILGVLGILTCSLAGPILSYLNATVYSTVGNTSEYREDLTSEEIMKSNVKETMELNVKKQMIYGGDSLAGNIIGYNFLGLLSSRSLYNFKKRYITVIISQEQGWFDKTDVFQLPRNYKLN